MSAIVRFPFNDHQMLTLGVDPHWAGLPEAHQAFLRSWVDQQNAKAAQAPIHYSQEEIVAVLTAQQFNDTEVKEGLMLLIRASVRASLGKYMLRAIVALVVIVAFI